MKNFKVNQRWRCRDGVRATILEIGDCGRIICWRASDAKLVLLHPNGCKLENAADHNHDLMELWREMKTFEIGQQWKCRDGNMAVIVRAPCGGGALVWLDYHGQALWFDKDGKRGMDGEGIYDLIEPWTEKRAAEEWVYMYDRGSEVFIDLAEPKHFSLNVKLIARKKITMTEGEGMDTS